MAKGIRVNQLAKELGIESKSILGKLREEGLGAQAPNHMSVLSLGLTESVRQWFASGESSSGGGTAIETAPPVTAPAKPKRARPSRGKTAKAAAENEPEATTAPEPSAVASEPAAAPEAVAAAPEAPVAAEPAAPAVDAVETTLAPEIQPPVESAEPVAPAPVEEQPRVAASVEPVAPAHPAPESARPPVARPTVTLTSHGSGPATVERKAVIPAPQLRSLEPAKMQGPKIIRVEKPEAVAVRKPRPMNDSSSGVGYTTARPQTGRGVKVTEEDEEEKNRKAAAKKSPGRSTRRGGNDGRRGEAIDKIREYSEADLEERRRRIGAATTHRLAVDRQMDRSQHRGMHTIAKTGVQRGEPIAIEEPITVRTLSAALGIKGNDIITKLMKQGVFANINQSLDTDTAQSIALEYGAELIVEQQATMEEQLVREFDARESEEAVLLSRPPVVTILGHVDHGKTSLLDKIRNANVAAGEAGGITQHTAAWMVRLGEGDTAKRVTFIDTPGHQAFTSMPPRGANMTDVVVLVVSAAEGVQPQTIESINHAKAAEVPIVVAMNKIDRPDANPDMVLGQLAAQGLNPVEWGGETEVIRTSAVTGQGIKDLIEILDYQAELLDLKTDPTAAARGAVIESRVDQGLGSVATVLVQEGTLKLGDIILSGSGYGRLRSLLNDRGEMIQEATASMPVVISGLNEMPGAGGQFYVVEDIDRARAIAEERALLSRQQSLAHRTQVSFESLTQTMREGAIKTINLIVKGDVQGSVETLAKTVTDQNTDEVRVRVIHSAVGGINESDVELADASGAVIIGFNVVPEESARAMAEQRRVEIRLYRVIYEIFDDLKKALSGMLEPEVREKLHGHAEVRQVFKVSRLGNIGGCIVTDGHIQRGSKIRLTRDGKVITEDLSIETLRRLKDDVREVKAGLECGIKLSGYDDIKVGDVLEAYIRETFQRTL